MKLKYAFLTLLAGAALAFTGCVEEAPVNDPALAVDVEPSILYFDGKTAGSAEVTVTATASWSATNVPSWMTLTPPSGSAGTTKVTVAVEVGGEKARGAEVVFKAGADSKILTVNQEGGTTYGTLENPYTCAKAIEFCATLADKAKGPKEVYVKGIITRIVEKYGTQYGNATFFMSDDGSADSPEFEVYRALYFDNKKYDDVTKQNISVGDEVMVYGMIMNYGGQAETSQNEAYLYSLKAGTNPVLTGDVTGVELLADETQATFTVTAKNLKGKWTVTPKETYSWVTDYTKEGTESGDIVVKVAANTAEEARTAEFTVAAEGVSPVTLTLTQKGAKIVTDVAGIAAQITSTDSKNPSAYSANLTGAVVSYVNGGNAYIEDASGAILLYKADHGLTAGQKISGTVKGTGYLYNALPEITSLGDDVKIEDGGTIPETVMTIADLVANYQANLSRRIKLVDVTVTGAMGKDDAGKVDRNGEVAQGDNKINVYAQKNDGSLVMAEGAKGDLICYPTLYKETKQVSFWDNADFSSSTPSITTDKDRLEIEPDATEAKFVLTAKNLKKVWTVTPKATYDWVTEYTKEGATSGDIVITVTPNPGEARTAEFTVASEGAASLTLTLVQKGAGMAPNIAGIAAQITSTSSSAPSSYKANLTEPAVVSYVNGNNVYIEDASGAILLYMKGHGLAPGVKLSGVMEGSGYLYNGLPEITAIGGDVKKEDGGEIPLTTLTIADLVANYQANLSRRIKLVGVTVKDAISDGDRTGVVTQNNADINVYAGLNNKGLAMAEGAKGDLICYPTLYNETKQVSFWDNADWTVSSGPADDAIKTADQLLAWMAAPTADAKLGADIDLAGKEVTPVAEFTGTLDGQGHSIKNWTSAGVPLIQVNKGTVKNVVLDASCKLTIVPGTLGFIAATNEGTIDGCVNNANATCSVDLTEVTYFGAITGRSTGVVKNCVNKGDITFESAADTKSNNCIGGVVGQVAGTSGVVAIENCTNSGAVKYSSSGTPKNMYIGGVVGGSIVNKKGANADNGLKDYGIVKGCTNTGAVSHIWAVNNSGSYCDVGGVAGYIEGAIEGCTNKGTVTLQDSEDKTTSSTRPALGGVVGYVTKSAKNCTNEGTVIAKGVWAAGTEGNAGAAGMYQPIFGGVIGGAGELYQASCEGLVSGCINKGKMDLQVCQKEKGGTNAGCGGVVGYSSVPVSDCHNKGELNIGLWHKVARVGGVIGWSYATTITKCTNTGALTFDCNSAALGANTTNYFSYQDYVGGVIGGSRVAATITDCENSGTVTYKGGVTTAVLNYIGGIMATYDGAQTMTGCKNSGKIVVDSAEAVEVGSLCGAFNGVMTKCEATGDVEVKKCVGVEGKEPEIGTLVGYANASFVDCTATNKVTVEAGGTSFYGGICGGFGKDVVKQWSGCTVNTTLNTSGSVTKAKFLGRFRNNPSDGTIIYYKDMTFGGNIGSLEIVGLANGGAFVEGTMPAE